MPDGTDRIEHLIGRLSDTTDHLSGRLSDAAAHLSGRLSVTTVGTLMWFGTRAEYNALAVIDPDICYCIEEGT